MRIASMIARYLLGLGFILFGLNGFLHFIPQPPMPPGPALSYLTILASTHYMQPVFALELLAGIFLIVNRFIALAVTILGPILVNILLFHVFMQPSGLPIAVVFVLLWARVFYSVRSAFDGIFQSQVQS